MIAVQTTTEANEQYQNILAAAKDNLGPLLKYVDENTGEIKSKWEIFYEDVGQILGDLWEDIKTGFGDAWEGIKTGFSDFATSFGNGWRSFWRDNVGKGLEGALNGIISGVEKGLNWVINALNKISFTTPDWLPFGMGGKHFGLNIPTITLGRVALFEKGGFPTKGQLFIANESGPELLGRIGNRTAVANQDQITNVIARIASQQFERYAVKDNDDGDDRGSEMVVNALYSATNRLIRAIEDNSNQGGGMSLGSLATQITNQQNRQNIMYGKSLQNV